MQQDFTLKAYDYHLPAENIAQYPAEKRDTSRLLVLNNRTKDISHTNFSAITDLIQEGDMLVVNDTRVFPARLHGFKETGGKVEVFLLEFPALTIGRTGVAEATALLKSSKRPQPQTTITISDSLSCTILALLDGGKARLQLHFDPHRPLAEILSSCGQVPLPPYIARKDGSTAEDAQRYQTVYANQPGAVAAPTAGLHLTETLLEKLQLQGVAFGTITLHVGYGTFAPVRTEQIREHAIHEEFIVVPEETVEKVKATKERGGKIWAVGTTTVRALEYAALPNGMLKPISDWCNLYIYPGFRFKVIDNLITNFHLPESSLMFLVSALCGRETLLDCYTTAIKEGYKFYSYGDAMAIITEPATATEERGFMHPPSGG